MRAIQTYRPCLIEETSVHINPSNLTCDDHVRFKVLNFIKATPEQDVTSMPQMLEKFESEKLNPENFAELLQYYVIHHQDRLSNVFRIIVAQSREAPKSHEVRS